MITAELLNDRWISSEYTCTVVERRKASYVYKYIHIRILDSVFNTRTSRRYKTVENLSGRARCRRGDTGG